MYKVGRHHGAWANLVGHHIWDVVIVGSNPAAPIILIITIICKKYRIKCKIEQLLRFFQTYIDV